MDLRQRGCHLALLVAQIDRPTDLLGFMISVGAKPILSKCRVQITAAFYTALSNFQSSIITRQGS